MEEQPTFAGLGSKVYVFRKEDFQEGVTFDEKKEKASGFPIGVIIPNTDGSYLLIGDEKIDVKNRVYTTDNPDPKSENWCNSFSLSAEMEVPKESDRWMFRDNEDEVQNQKYDVTIQTKEGTRYLVKDANITYKVCQAAPIKNPLLLDKLPCDMITPLCYPLRWGDRHFNRRIAHYQWMKKHNYL